MADTTGATKSTADPLSVRQFIVSVLALLIPLVTAAVLGYGQQRAQTAITEARLVAVEKRLDGEDARRVEESAERQRILERLARMEEKLDAVRDDLQQRRKER